MIGSDIVLITSGSAARIATSEDLWGRARLLVDQRNGIIGVVGTSNGPGKMVLDPPATELHPITLASQRQIGVWAVTDATLHEAHQHGVRIDHDVQADFFRSRVPGRA